MPKAAELWDWLRGGGSGIAPSVHMRAGGFARQRYQNRVPREMIARENMMHRMLNIQRWMRTQHKGTGTLL